MQPDSATAPPRKRRRSSPFGTRHIGLFWSSWAFVIAAALVWFCVNAFVVARLEGFDPFRYEYFAREGLSDDLLLATGYRIVILLQWIYEYLPHFFGFAMFCAALHSALALSLRNKALLWALFNPITFYYIGQTGKDGIAILAFVAMAMVASNPARLGRHLAAYLVIVIALIVRPPIGIFLPLILLLFRRGPRPALAASLLLGFAFLIVADQASIADSLLGLVTRDDETDITQSARDFTFGTDIPAIAVRLILYLFSIFFQPVVGLAKFLSSFDFFLLYEALAYLTMLFIVIRKHLLKQFLVASLPFVVLVAIIFPFYHFRYLAVTYPLVLAFLMTKAVQSGKLSQRRLRKRHTPPAPADTIGLENACTNG